MGRIRKVTSGAVAIVALAVGFSAMSTGTAQARPAAADCAGAMAGGALAGAGAGATAGNAVAGEAGAAAGAVLGVPIGGYGTLGALECLGPEPIDGKAIPEDGGYRGKAHFDK